MPIIRSVFPILTFVAGLVLLCGTGSIEAQQPQSPSPIVEVTLIPAPPIVFPGETDSNSPAFWDRSGATPTLHVLNSLRHPTLSTGPNVRRLQSPQPVQYNNMIDGGRWMEAVIQDDDGTLYGYYHNEPTSVCRGFGKTAPRIGAARSSDGGRSWQDLGIILEAPMPHQCWTPNQYFVGGVGDFSVTLNQARTDLYFFFSTYSGKASDQGVAVARLWWADRNWPVGLVEVWEAGAWTGPQAVTDEEGEVIAMQHPAATPIYPAAGSWHSFDGVDAFWGPSVHWNTYLNQYVMLLNRANAHDWTQEGIYISLAPSLEDPSAWSAPQKLYEGGAWYPQVIGLEPGQGTDKLAGRVARLFMGGRSEHLIQFRQRQ